MSTRACLPCRTARIKCDLVRPACGRCVQQGLSCSGYPLQDVFVFRDENEVAERNSRRARKRPREQQSPAAGSSSSSVVAPYRPQSSTTGDELDAFIYQHYSWLSQHAFAEVSEPLKRDIETRAIERFFINWTLHPSSHGASAGHMEALPTLYLEAQADSILGHAIRAVAFADVRNQMVDNVPSFTKAQNHYGSALRSMRTIINNQEDLGNDVVLSAMLLIDNFELMYLARNDPLGPHNEAIKHVLRARGDGQLYTPTRFSLWRLTHFRLQSWQTLFREEPDAQQVAWMTKLNTERPDLRICSNVLQMNILSASARRMTQNTEGTAFRAEKINRAIQLAREMQGLNASIENWASEIAGVWKGTTASPENVVQPQEIDEPLNFPIPYFPYPHLISYNDIWLAYVWNFYAASQIIFRESLVDVLQYVAILQGQEEPNEDDAIVIETQRNWVDALSTAVIGSFPMLLGFTHKHEKMGPVRIPRQGKMAGRLFALFSMWAIQRAQFTSAQHKQTASEVVAWINSRHGLT